MSKNSKKRNAIFRKLKDKPCYLCGNTPEKGDLTVDHVPPQGLSPFSPTSSFLLLPAHRSCNNKYSYQEEKFVTFLAMACGYKGNASADAAWAAAERGFKRNEFGRAGAPSKDLRRLFENSVPVEVRSPEGIIIASTRLCWPADDIDVELILAKIARGLHYHHTKTFVPETWKVTVNLGSLRPGYQLYASNPIIKSFGDFFAYSGGFDEGGSIWYMRIYDEAYALVRIDNPLEEVNSTKRMVVRNAKKV